MNCMRFEELLDHFLAGSLSLEARRDAQAHLRECPGCSRLAQIAGGDPDPLPANLSADLTRTILDRTSGRACGRALDLACGLVDGELEAEEHQLVSVHLEHCLACSALVGTLAELKQALPEMAELEPPRTLVGAVLRATSVQAAFPARPASRFMERMRAWASQPRFSLEAAYLGTLLLVALLGNPATILNRTSPLVLSMVHADIPGAWNAAVQRVPSGWVDIGRTTLGETGTLARQAWQAGAASGRVMIGLLEGDEQYWEPVVSTVYNRTLSSVNGVVSLIRETGSTLFEENATGSTPPGREN
jgi:predicted anti-sigma-YlaC factor YlaD